MRLPSGDHAKAALPMLPSARSPDPSGCTTCSANPPDESLSAEYAIHAPLGAQSGVAEPRVTLRTTVASNAIRPYDLPAAGEGNNRPSEPNTTMRSITIRRDRSIAFL